MTRGAGLILVLISLVIGAVLFTMQSKSAGPTSPAVAHDEALALSTAAVSVFQPVAQVLQVDEAQSGTYVGAQLPAGSGVTVVNATSSSYCLEASLDGTLMHEEGPSGAPAQGPC